MTSFWPSVSHAVMAQPEPWMPSAVASNWARYASNEPKWSSMAAPSSPSGLSPPSGERFFQKIEWLMWPPRLNARFFSSRLIVSNDSDDARLLELLERGVEPVHVVLVVLAVVQLHDLARDVRVKRSVVVGQIGK